MVTTGTELSFTTLAVPLGLFAAFAAAHIAARIFAPGADPAILPVVFRSRASASRSSPASRPTSR